MANLDGAFAAAFINLVSGAFMVKYIQFVGTDLPRGDVDRWVGIFAALPALLGLLQIPGAIWGRQRSSYKSYVSLGGLMWRILHIPLLLLLFVSLPPNLTLTIVIVSLVCASAAVQLVSPIYNDWLAEMVPDNSRGWFFSRRNMIASGVGAGAALIGGFTFSAFEKTDPRMGFITVFVLGGIAAIVSLIFYNQMQDIPRENPLQTTVKAGVQAMMGPFKDRNFRPSLWFLAIFVTSQAFAGNLWSSYAFESLRMPMNLFQITSVTHAIGSIVFVRMWGFLSDKYGNKPILAIVAFGITLTPFPWLFCRPGQDYYNLAILSVCMLFAGANWGGVAVCQYNLVLANAKPAERANYLGAAMALQALVSFAAPLAGAELMRYLRWNLNDPIAAYFWVFSIVGVMRLMSIGFLLRVKEEGATPIKEALQEISKVSPTGFKALRQMTHTSDDVSREVAIAAAASKHLEMAREDIIKALRDPSPKVRRQAARGLAEIGGSGAVDAILQIFREHPDLVEEEHFEALQSLGDQRALPELLAAMTSPRPMIRRAAAKALGEIGGEDAEQALRKAAGQSGDPDLRRASLQGLRQLESQTAGEEIADALLDPHPSVRVAAAEAVEYLNVRSAAPNLRAGLARFTDEAGSEIAYALGAVGDRGDLITILNEARRSTSAMTRRRCLLGVARIYEVEPSVYRLLLLEDMSLDAAILALLEPAMKREPAIRAAMDRFTRDEEVAAVKILAGLEPSLAPLHEVQVHEAFLVAAATIHRLHGIRSTSKP
jgi:HEAT repeat protein/MFS family permease